MVSIIGGRSAINEAIPSSFNTDNLLSCSGLHNRDDNGRQGPRDGDAAAPQDEHEAEQEQQQPGTSGASSLHYHQVGADPEEP